jgi:glycosyltransferase involved in cell wall biosynthesis
MFASRLLKDKGIFEFVHAAKLVKKNFENDLNKITFAVVGDVDSENKASIDHNLLDEWEQIGLIQYWGYSDRIESMLQKADIFVLPSYREGMPKILQEASASSLPVITTDVPGCRDAIIPNETGLLVPARDSEALSSAIIELLYDHKRAKLLGQNGRKYAEKNFDVNLVARKHIEIYKFLDSQNSIT